MAREGYERQVGPGGSPAIGGVDPGAFGGVGGAIASFGGAIHQDDVRAHQLETERRRDSETFAFARQRAEMGAANSALFEQAKTEMPADGTGFRARLLADHDERAAAILPSDPRARERAEAQLAEDRARLSEKADLWERGQRVATITNDAKATSATLANGVYLAPSTDGLGKALDDYDHLIDGTTLLTDPQKVAAKREFAGQAIESGVQGLFSQGRLDDAAHWLNSDLATSSLDPDRLTVLGNALEVEVRRRDAVVRQGAALAKADAREQVELVTKQLGDGIDVPDATLATAQAAAAAAGLDGKVYDIQIARLRAGVNRETQSWTPTDFGREIQRLSAKGAKGSADEQVRLDQLRKIAGGRTAEFAGDPGAWAARSGRPMPALDLSDPRTVAARGAWARGVEKTAGRWTPMLSGSEAQPIVDQIQHGSANDRLAAAATIGAFGGDAPRVLRQVAGSDEPFKIAVRLATLPSATASQQLVRDALLGPDARKANVAIFDSKVAKGFGLSEAKRIFAEEISPAIGETPGYAAGVLETALNIYASRALRRGDQAWNEQLFRGAIQGALGGYDDHGTFVGGIGGRNGRPVALPAGMAPAEFDRRLSRAMPDDWGAAAIPPRSFPVWGNGAGVSIGQMRQAVPVALGDGIYGFRSGNGWLMSSQGERYRVDARRLNPR